MRVAKNSFIIEISRKKMIDNYEYLVRKTGKKMIAVVKSNAYGIGLRETVMILNENGCDYFAVSREREIKSILNMGLSGIKILFLDILEDFIILKENKNIEMVVTDIEVLKSCIKQGISCLQLHIRLDFGFCRSGFKVDELERLIDFIQSKNLRFRGIMGHLFSADKDDMEIIEKQFTEIVEKIGKERFEVIHLLNSDGVENIQCEIATHIRCGQHIFGLQTKGKNNKNIKKVFELKGKIFDITEIGKSEYIGYSKINDLILKGYKRVGQVKIGYGDGFLRKYENIMSIINNKKYRVIHISMDVSFVVVDENIKNGDEVELFFDFEEIEEKESCEVLVNLNERIERVVK